MFERKIPNHVLEVGRDAIRRGNLNELIWWHRRHLNIDENLIGRTYGRCFCARDYDKALHLFEATAGTHDPLLARVGLVVRTVALMIALAALVGGIGWWFQ